MIELVDRDIKRGITVFHMFKKQKEILNVRDMGDIKRPK